jgi:hypothetical protein
MAQAFTFRAFGAGKHFNRVVLSPATLLNAFGVSDLRADDLVEAQGG